MKNWALYAAGMFGGILGYLLCQQAVAATAACAGAAKNRRPQSTPRGAQKQHEGEKDVQQQSTGPNAEEDRCKRLAAEDADSKLRLAKLKQQASQDSACMLRSSHAYLLTMTPSRVASRCEHVEAIARASLADSRAEVQCELQKLLPVLLKLLHEAAVQARDSTEQQQQQTSNKLAGKQQQPRRRTSISKTTPSPTPSAHALEQQLVSLLLTIIKLSCAAPGIYGPALLGAAAAYCMCHVRQHMASLQQDDSTPAPAAGVEAITALCTWLALLGRCCMVWVHGLQMKYSLSGSCSTASAFGSSACSTNSASTRSQAAALGSGHKAVASASAPAQQTPSLKCMDQTLSMILTLAAPVSKLLMQSNSQRGGSALPPATATSSSDACNSDSHGSHKGTCQIDKGADASSSSGAQQSKQAQDGSAPHATTTACTQAASKQFAAFCITAGVNTLPIQQARAQLSRLSLAFLQDIRLAKQVQHKQQQQQQQEAKQDPLQQQGQHTDDPLTQQQQQEEASATAPSSSSPQSSQASLLDAFQDFGASLSVLPMQGYCNNPWCSNLSGGSELQLVGRPAQAAAQCGGCGTAVYCSKDCHLQHWKLHKLVCRKVVKRVVGGAAEASCTAG